MPPTQGGAEKSKDIVAMLLSPALPWGRPACGRSGCPLQLVPPFLEHGLRALGVPSKP